MLNKTGTKPPHRTKIVRRGPRQGPSHPSGQKSSAGGPGRETRDRASGTGDSGPATPDLARKDVRPVSPIFYLLAALTLAGGLATVLLKHLVHAALAVTVAFAGLALLFLELDAQFAGFAQILVYIGAVAILIVFAILLTHGSELPREGVFSKTWFLGW